MLKNGSHEPNTATGDIGSLAPTSQALVVRPFPPYTTEIHVRSSVNTRGVNGQVGHTKPARGQLTLGTMYTVQRTSIRRQTTTTTTHDRKQGRQHGCYKWAGTARAAVTKCVGNTGQSKWRRWQDLQTPRSSRETRGRWPQSLGGGTRHLGDEQCQIQMVMGEYEMQICNEPGLRPPAMESKNRQVFLALSEFLWDLILSR